MSDDRSTWSGKADFEGIYTAPDPRPFYRTLGELDYRLPEHAARLFGGVLDEIGDPGAGVVDVCCSYGVNAMFLRHDLTLPDVVHHFRRDPGGADPIERDRAFFTAHREPVAPPMVGVDAASAAIDYATAVGLLDDGFAENLEVREPSADLAAAIADCGLITVSGGIGYISPVTLTRLIDAMPHVPWVAVTVLRQVPYTRFAEALAGYGLVTSRFGEPFRQRRFADDAERDAARARLIELGLDPGPDDGYYYAECLVSRPA